MDRFMLWLGRVIFVVLPLMCGYYASGFAGYASAITGKLAQNLWVTAIAMTPCALATPYVAAKLWTAQPRS